MSATTSARPARSRPAAFAVPLSADVLAPVAVAAWCAVLLALTWNTWGDLGRDTGYDLLAASRVAGGDLPYVDYVYFYGPVAPLLLGGLYAVLGSSVEVAIVLGLALAGTIIALTFALGRRLAGPMGGGLAAALAATAAFGTANNSYVMPHSLSAPLGMALALGVVLALLGFARSGARNGLVLAGVLAGLTTLTRPELAAWLVVALLIWTAARLLEPPADRRAAVRDAAALLAPVAALPLVVYGAFAAATGVRPLLLENLYPQEQLRQGGRVVLSGLAPLTAESFVTLAGRLVLYALGAALLIAAGVAIARAGRGRLIVIAAAAVAALGFIGLVAARPETTRYYLQFAYAWIPAGAWIATGVLGWSFRRRGGLWTAEAQGPLLVSLLLALVATTAYGAFYPHARPAGPQATAYAMPLIGCFLAWLHLVALPRGRAGTAALGAGWLALLAVAGAGLVVHDARAETETVRGAHGALAATPAQGAAYQGAVTAIERGTRPGERILLAPQLTTLYVMTGRENPLPQLSLLPGSLATPADEDTAIAAMDDVRFAITDRRELTLYGHGAFGQTFDQRLAAWLRDEFRHVATLRGSGPDAQVLDVWERSAA